MVKKKTASVKRLPSFKKLQNAVGHPQKRPAMNITKVEPCAAGVDIRGNPRYIFTLFHQPSSTTQFILVKVRSQQKFTQTSFDQLYIIEKLG